MPEVAICGTSCNYTDCPHYCVHTPEASCKALPEAPKRFPWCAPCRILPPLSPALEAELRGIAAKERERIAAKKKARAREVLI